jgi:RHS repeat-associated protein
VHDLFVPEDQQLTLQNHLRRRASPIALLSYASFFLAMTPVRPAHAKDGTDDDPTPPVSTPPTEAPKPKSEPPPKIEASLNHARQDEPRSLDGRQVVNPEAAQGRAEIKGKDSLAANKTMASSAPAVAPMALPTGADKTGVSSQAISVPSGAGKIQGMGESFSAQLSTGIATFNVPIALPTARGAAQPVLALSYSSSGGHGAAGMGWSIGVPFVARQTDRGIPRYQDPGEGKPWHAAQDRFIFNGGQELVPICQVVDAIEASTQGPDCLDDQGRSAKLADEQMPDWASGWQYFRARVEGSFQRFFWSPDHRTWRVQDKSGVTMELGVPLDGSGYTKALEVDPDHHDRIFRWNLSREYDARIEATGARRPLNVVAFRYNNENDGEEAYLSDIFDTSPATDPTTSDLSTYAHHTHLEYEPRPDVTVSYRRGWRTAMTRRLARIDVASHTFEREDHRRLVRRYFLDYERTFHVSLLAGVQLEGRCAEDERSAPQEGSDQIVSPTDCSRTGATTLPEMAFGYQHVAYDADGNPKNGDLPGYEEFDGTIRTFANSPDFSVDEEQTDLFDINSDGLPDVLVTNPGLFKNKHGVFLNGFGGKPDSFAQCSIGVIPGTLNATATDITLKNLNLSVQDLDGDGTIDLLHMPSFKKYAVYTPTGGGCEWMWRGREIDTASGQNLKIDFGKDALETKVMDVDADGLVDVVFSGGTEFQTFFSLGRYPGGDGQFGHATWTGATTATISNDPVVTCVPWDGTPVRFSDPDIKLGDMNGDGLADLVRVRRGDIRYWPGRGSGLWGTGKLDDCPAGKFGQARDIIMTRSPNYSDITGDSLRLDDVNGDGLDDLVQVRFDGVDVWLNVDGDSWTARHIIAGTPPSPSFANRVRLVDVNGSGTRDILWADAQRYKYIDLSGGQRPWVLTRVDNGLGKTTSIEYSTSAAMMLAAEAAGRPWDSKAPMPLHVVTRVTERDNLEIVGRAAGRYVTEYTYRDAVYDGRQREFRGFRQGESKKVGDDNSPTSITSIRFSLGECKDENPGDDIDPCAPSERWRDDGREALKGLPVLTEISDESGVYLSTAHQTYTLRHLYAGLDGRPVRYAFESATDTFVYDTGSFATGESSTTIPEVVLEATGTSTTEQGSVVLRSSATKRARIHSSSVVDAFGNKTDGIASGCMEAAGCPNGVDEILTAHTDQARPSGDKSGWLWRPVRSYVTGDKHPGIRRNEREISYNAAGDPVQTRMVLSGTLPLDRHHDTPGRELSHGPHEASGGTQDPVTVILLDQTIDPFGNVNFQAGANARCREVVFDPFFKQFAVNETVFAGRVVGACGVVELESDATYDRGLAAVTLAHDLHGEVTLAGYDNLGRPVSVTKPHPDQLGSPSPLPSVKIEYLLTDDAKARPYSIVHTQTQDGRTLSESEYMDTWAYIDGMGRAIVTLSEADPDPETDGDDFIASGLTEYDNKGAERRRYLAFLYNGSPTSFPLAKAPAAPYGRQRYDAFGRQVETYGLDGTITLRTVHHGLSDDKFDAADILPGPHQGTHATTHRDGHGREVAEVERIHAGSAIEAREMKMAYLPTGEPEVITRVHVGKADPPVIRWMRYDSQGRRVLNVEPNTTKNFNSNPGTDAGQLSGWRYAYNDVGDLVGMSDARGCGVDYYYDAAGRLVGEDYSPCVERHAMYSTANREAGTGFEVRYQYDELDASDPVPEGAACRANLALGRLVSVSDRASKIVTCYDGRGRVTSLAKRIAKPNAEETPEDRYTPRWYLRKFTFDSADRPIVETTGAEVPFLMGPVDGASQVTTHYSPRGAVKSVDGSYGTLVANVAKDADGLTREVKYGDAAGTTTSFSHDDRRRLSSVQTYRGPPDLWKVRVPNDPYDGDSRYSSPNDQTFQLLLQDQDITYDDVDNPLEIRDWRLPEEWPDGARPVTRKMSYDDLYRLTRIDYEFAGGSDRWVDPFAAEASQTNGDPRRARPSPRVSFDRRVQQQTFSYDWLGNTNSTDDDAHAFYDRSLGIIANGVAGEGPYQLRRAQNDIAQPTSERRGSLLAAYDAAGNLTKLALRRHGTCIPTNSCTQGFVYDWDETGRMVEARRWELSGTPTTDDLPPPPSVTPSVQLRYAYDVNDTRVIKTAIEGGQQTHTVYVFGSLELRRTHFDTAAEPHDYERTPTTEVPYLGANGIRLAHVLFERDQTALPTINGSRLHVLLEVDDQLGSTNTILDRTTGELVEATTYQPCGAVESDYRPIEWDSFREDYRFTGKEEDIEVGLIYFGKRFLSPYLGRWASPDPLAVHAPGEADWTLYAYVRGHLFAATDPVGLADNGATRVPFGPKGAAPGTAFVFGAGGDRVVPPEEFSKVADGKQLFIYDPKADLPKNIDVSKLTPEQFTQVVQNALQQALGNCTGPACGTGKKGQEVMTGQTTVGDAAAQLSGVANLVPPGVEGGKPGGHPLGMCSTCEGSPTKQAATTAAATINQVMPDALARAARAGKAIAVGKANLRALGLEGVNLSGKSYNAGRKALEKAGFTLEETTSTGRKVFVNTKTGARVNFDSGKALAPGQKPHWHVQDSAGNNYGRTGRAVASDERAAHIPAK